MSEAVVVAPPGSSRPAGPEWTYADLAATPDDGQVYEIVEGKLLMSPQPSRQHQHGEFALARLLADAAPPEFVVLTECDLDLGRNVFVPDVVVFREAAYAREGPLRAADLLLAVEVTSPSSRSMDRIIKPTALAAAGVPHYWRGDLEGDPFVEIYELDAGVYKLADTARAGTPLQLTHPFPVELDAGLLRRRRA